MTDPVEFLRDQFDLLRKKLKESDDLYFHLIALDDPPRDLQRDLDLLLKEVQFLGFSWVIYRDAFSPDDPRFQELDSEVRQDLDSFEPVIGILSSFETEKHHPEAWWWNFWEENQ